MIEYQVMGQSLVLPICLHGGAVPLVRLPALAVRTDFEDQFGLEPGAHARFLHAISRRYGATGLAAVEDDLVVGLVRFYPRALREVIGQLCPQDEPFARRLASTAVESLPKLDDLRPRELQIACLQVIPERRGRGIGRALIRGTVAWAGEQGWDEIYAPAIRHILPLMSWSGQMSAASLQKQGFEIVGQEVDDGLQEAALSQQLGYHGEAVQRVWEEQYAHISAEEAAVRYEMRLVL
jgi:GNAT superfamily N-acetyltransferase